MSVEERVIQLIAQACHQDAAMIGRDTEYINDLGVTKSIAYFQLATLLEAEFDVRVDFTKIKNSGTVGITVDYIQGLVPQA